MTIWYTADTHLGHDNIIKHSGLPYDSASHMDAMLLANLSARVGPTDTLWIVGDFAFCPKAKDKKWLSNLFARLPGKEKHLVVGNHDGEATQELPWTSISYMAEVADGSGAPAVLNHYPMITWHRARRGASHLFGQVHNQWIGRRNAVNVGVDVWGDVPVTIRDFAQRAKTLPENKHWQDVEHNAEI